MQVLVSGSRIVGRQLLLVHYSLLVLLLDHHLLLLVLTSMFVESELALVQMVQSVKAKISYLVKTH